MGSNLTFHRYHVTALSSIQEETANCKFFLKKSEEKFVQIYRTFREDLLHFAPHKSAPAADTASGADSVKGIASAHTHMGTSLSYCSAQKLQASIRQGAKNTGRWKLGVGLSMGLKPA